MNGHLQVYPELSAVEARSLLDPLEQFDERLETGLCLDEHSNIRRSAGTTNSQKETRPFESIIYLLVEPELEITAAALSAQGHGTQGQVMDEWASSLKAVLFEVYARVLVRQLAKFSTAEILEGASPEERYRSYIEGFDDTVLEQLHDEYPMLLRIHRHLVATRRRSLVEMLNRLQENRPEIEKQFEIPTIAEVATVDLGRGDTHSGGRSVAVITFDSGAKLVYKPRPVDCEAGYAELAAWCSKRDIALHAARVLPCAGYGFVEFITEVVVDRDRSAFMFASGQLACVLYCLNARDMHHENVLADKRGPVPVDLETLLHPRRNRSSGLPEVARNAHEILATSIYGVGLLPLIIVRENAAGGYEQIDLGFLGAEEDGRSPFSVLSYTNPFRDDMALVLSRPDKQGLRTSTIRAHSRDEVLRLADSMATGFRSAYNTLSAVSTEFEAAITVMFGHAQVRYVHNPTATYAQLLRTTTSPEALASPKLSYQLLKRLVIANRHSAPELTATEVSQMVSRDVPYLLIDAGSTDICDASGRSTGATVPESPLQTCIDKIRRMCDPDLRQQIDLIYAAFTARFPDNHLEPISSAGTSVSKQYESLTGLAARIGGELADSMFSDLFDHLPATWLSTLASTQIERPWPPGVLGYDLYSGRIGPALALASLGTVLNTPQFHTAASKVFDPMASILSDRSYEDRSLSALGAGAYSGLSGCLFALAAAGKIAGRHDWVAAARSSIPDVVARARGMAASDGGIDVVSGRIGIQAALRSVAGDEQESVSVLDDFAWEVINEIRAGLLMPIDDRDQALRQSGFAHGIAGMIFHLTTLGLSRPGALGDAAQHLAGELFDELGQFYSPERCNWRVSLDHPHYSTGWCHGVSGMALALHRLASAGFKLGAQVDDSAEQASETLGRQGFSRNLTLCHGDLGNWEVLQSVAPPEQVRSASSILSAHVIGTKSHDRHSRYANTASLMVGTAGVAYHLARRLEPDLPYSPLTLGIGGPA